MTTEQPHDRRTTVPPTLLADIDRVLRDHGLELPREDVQTALAWLLSGHHGDVL